MIVRMTEQYTICGDNEISDHKIRFIFIMYNTIKWYPSCEDMKHYDWTRHNLWVQRILRLQNIFCFCYLQDDQTMHNLWGHHRYLETIMLHTFNRSRLLKNKRAFVKFINCWKLLHGSLNRQTPLTFSWWNILKFSFRPSLFIISIYGTKFFHCRFSMISRLIVISNNKEFVKILGRLKIDRITWQYTICGINEISDYKIPFIFKIYNTIKWYTSYKDIKHYDWTRHNLWVQRILRLQNLFHFHYLQDERTIHNLWGHNRTLETIMFHSFNSLVCWKWKEYLLN